MSMLNHFFDYKAEVLALDVKSHGASANPISTIWKA